MEGWQNAPRLSRGHGSTQEYNGPAYISMLFSPIKGKAVYRIASNEPFSARTPAFSFIAPFGHWAISGDEVQGSYGKPWLLSRYALTRIKPLAQLHFLYREYGQRGV
ncbi:TPA: hypothetical protein HA251_00670 [Candidatus Woesearchaeota archaeon]|nr:hypothetical protein [Candidatus Woesearchaeota archaeon]